MDVVREISTLRTRLDKWRAAGDRIALAPTMGNLHAGHLALVQRASTLADRVVVSIFVNPTQFVQNEDFDRYPRTPEHDASLLSATRAELIFLPSVAEMYPRGLQETTRVQVPELDGILCGEFRPGHFSGVATIVSKLFNIVQPHVAVFGDKDFQQLLLIRHLVADLCFPIEIVGMETVRESDGLAMSSRNGYLSPTERSLAPRLYKILVGVAEELSNGQRDFAKLEAGAMAQLTSEGFRPQYVAIRSAASLTIPAPDEKRLVIVAAAFLGTTRLIDHIEVTVPSAQ
ncbi:MAG: pantoate--beta-alanine ligase [Gammaproteobacteria bacterium]